MIPVIRTVSSSLASLAYSYTNPRFGFLIVACDVNHILPLRHCIFFKNLNSLNLGNNQERALRFKEEVLTCHTEQQIDFTGIICWREG